MTWFKLDDQFPDHPKVLAAGGDAGWLHVCAGCYASKHETDGKVPKAIVARLSDRKNPTKLAAVLVDAGMWHDMGDYYEIHDFLEYNPSKAELDSRRQAKSMAGAMGAAKRWASVSHNTRNAPDPTRPKDQEHTSSEAELEFSEWWEDYPRKVNRKAALAAFRARRREGVTCADLETARVTYTLGRAATETRFIMHGSSFLAKDGPWTEWLLGNPESDTPARPTIVKPWAPDEPRRCPTCANTNNYFVNGVMTRCSHEALRSA